MVTLDMSLDAAKALLAAIDTIELLPNVKHEEALERFTFDLRTAVEVAEDDTE